MYIVQKPGGAEVFANRPEHGIDWGRVAPDCPVAQLSQEDWERAAAWKNHQEQTPYIPAVYEMVDGQDEQGNPVKLPKMDADGRPVILTPASGGEWYAVGNNLAIREDGSVELLSPGGQVDMVLPGHRIQ